jgi:hypothetical protein
MAEDEVVKAISTLMDALTPLDRRLASTLSTLS